MEHVSRLQVASSFLASAFIISACVFAGALFAPSSVHAAAPNGFTSKTFQDTDTDGAIDRVVVVINGGEALSACTVDATELASDWTYTGNSYGGSIASATCNTGTATITFVISGATAGITGGGTAPTIGYDNDDGDNSIANASGNLGAVAAGNVSDGAGAVLLSANPTLNKTGVLETSNVVLTYSEEIDSWTGSITGGITLTASIDTTTVTLSHAARFLAGQNTLTISTSPDDAANAFAGAQAGDSTVANPLIFYVTSSSGANADADSVVTYGVSLTSPAGDDSLEAGTRTDITWTSEGGGSYANLSYSVDMGSSWETIVTNTLNDGSYTWTVPMVDSDDVLVKVVTTDLAEELAEDTSSAFSIWYGSDEDMGDDDSEDVVEEDGDDSSSVPDEIDGISSGDYIMTAGGSTVYYVDESMMRRPFFDEATYFTYEDDFDAVVEVSAETLAQFTVGAPMLPKAGVVLVKIQSIAKVYMVEESSSAGTYALRWITSEDVAEDMFGASWSSYVVDVDATLFTRYDMGSDVDEVEDVDTDMMKYRTELHD